LDVTAFIEVNIVKKQELIEQVTKILEAQGYEKFQCDDPAIQFSKKLKHPSEKKKEQYKVKQKLERMGFKKDTTVRYEAYVHDDDTQVTFAGMLGGDIELTVEGDEVYRESKMLWILSWERTTKEIRYRILYDELTRK